MKKGTIIKTLVIFCAAAVIVGVCYYKIANGKNRKIKEEQDVTSTAVKNVLLRDLSKNYPPTPKEVMRFYVEITKCFYNEKYTDEELDELAHKVLELYDEELIAQKTEERYLNDLNADILEWREAKRTISSCSMSSSVDVENSKFIKDGYECAKVYCNYNLRIGTQTAVVTHVYILRKDSSGYWKIFGWDSVD